MSNSQPAAEPTVEPTLTSSQEDIQQATEQKQSEPTLETRRKSGVFSLITSGLTTFGKTAQNTTASLSPTLKSVTSSLTQKAASLPTNFQQFQRDLPATLTKLQTRITDMPRDLERENASFVQSKRDTGQNMTRNGTEPVAPWVGFEAYEEEIRMRLLKLSRDQRNFTVPPPEGTDFRFDMKVFAPSAAAVLKEDEELQKMRFELVPKLVSEPIFWRNYFYRVSLVKQSVLNEEALEETEIFSREKPEDILFDADVGNDEAESTIPTAEQTEFKTQTPSSSTIQQPLQEKNDNEDDAMEDWEKEMRKELGE